MDFGLTHKVALVGGSSSGIGFAIASELAAEGAHVMLTARREGPLRAAARRIAETGGSVDCVVTDMSRSDGVQAAVAATKSRFGMPEIAISNCAPTLTHGLDLTSDDQFRMVYEELIMSLVYLCRAVLPSMVERKWGRIVNVGSVCMKEPHRWHNLDRRRRRMDTRPAIAAPMSRRAASRRLPHGWIRNPPSIAPRPCAACPMSRAQLHPRPSC